MTPVQFQRARRKLGLTQKQLAHILGLNELTVRRYEMGEHCTNHRRVPTATAELINVFLTTDYRSKRWPKQEAA